MTSHVQTGDATSSSECPNCKGLGVVPEDDDQLIAFAAACGALPGDDCPNCEGRGVLDIDTDHDPDLLDALAAGMADGLGSLLDEDGCR